MSGDDPPSPCPSKALWYATEILEDNGHPRIYGQARVSILSFLAETFDFGLPIRWVEWADWNPLFWCSHVLGSA